MQGSYFSIFLADIMKYPFWCFLSDDDDRLFICPAIWIVFISPTVKKKNLTLTPDHIWPSEPVQGNSFEYLTISGFTRNVKDRTFFQVSVYFVTMNGAFNIFVTFFMISFHLIIHFGYFYMHIYSRIWVNLSINYIAVCNYGQEADSRGWLAVYLSSHKNWSTAIFS